MKLYFIVDAQNDFCHKDGVLYCDGANNTMENMKNKLEKLATRYENGDRSFMVLLTMDQHTTAEEYLSTLEGKNLPVPHCLLGTWGADLHVFVNDFAERILSHCPIIDDESTWKHSPIYIIEKGIFGAKGILSFFTGLNNIGIAVDEIEIMGFALDICLISNAVLIQTATEHKVPISVNMSCSAGTTSFRGKAAEAVLDSLQMNQIYEGE